MGRACPDLALNSQWEAYAVVDNEAEEGAIWIFREAEGAPFRRLPLRGLRPERAYELVDADIAQPIRETGARLMDTGISVDLSDRTSAFIRIRARHASGRVVL